MRRSLSRGAALALAVAVLALIWVGIAGPYLSRRAALTDRVELAERAAHRFADALTAADGGAATRLPAGLVMSGDSSSTAQAALQHRLDTALESSGGARTASTALDPVETGDRLHLRARVEGEATIESLADLLHGVETGLPLAFVERVEIVRQTRLGGDHDPQAPVPLDLRLTVGAPADFTPGTTDPNAAP